MDFVNALLPDTARRRETKRKAAAKRLKS
jgi:hypothetical protein